MTRKRLRYALRITSVLVLAAALLALLGTWMRGRPVYPATTSSPIADAARVGDFSTVRDLLAAGAGANQPAADGGTALLWASYHEDADVVQTLIEAGASVSTPNRYGMTALLQASRTGTTAVIRALLAAGADPNRAHPSGQTPLMAAARSGREEAVRALLGSGAEVNARDTLQGQTALMWAAAEGHLDAVRALLEAGADPNLRAQVNPLTLRANADYPSGGFTALMWAARNGHEDVLQRLLEAGADPNAVNGDGATATIIAIVNDRFDIAATLLAHGARPDDGALYHAVDMHDATTDMYALDGTRLRPDHPNRLTALDLIRDLLERGADPDQPFVGQLHSLSLCCGPYVTASPFYRAAIAADVEALRLMLAAGADLEWSPSRVEGPGMDGSFGTNTGPNEYAGWPPLRVAMKGGHGAPLANGPGVQQRDGPPPFREPASRRPIDAVTMLLDAGANPDAAGPDGSTALHQAAEAGQLDVIEALVHAGANLHQRNRDGLTALELAERLSASADPGDAHGHVVATLRNLIDRHDATAERAALTGAP